MAVRPCHVVQDEHGQVLVGAAIWSFLSTTTVFGTPREVTLSELAIEAFYPADDATRAALTAEGFLAG